MTLEIANICKSLGALNILNGISLTVPTSGVTGLIGPNGAGKSTLFGVISGFMRQDSGQISLNGVSLNHTSPVVRACSGMVRTFQVPREFRHMTVRENLLASAPDQPGEHLANLFLRYSRVRLRERVIRKEADSVIDFLKLGAVANVPAGSLSGGQKKLLELGRVMMVKPRLVLLDEPFAGVNAVLVQDIIDRIRELHRQGIGFWIIEHDLDALSAIVDELHVLDQGVLIASGAPDAVLSNRRVIDAYLGGQVS